MNPVDQQLAYQQMIGQRIDAGNQYALGLARLMQEGRIATTQLFQRERELKMKEDQFDWEKENIRPLQKEQLAQSVELAKANLRHALVMNPMLESEAQLRLTQNQMALNDAMDVAATSADYAKALQKGYDRWNQEGRLMGRPLDLKEATELEGRVPALRRNQGTVNMRQAFENQARWEMQYQRDALVQETNQVAELQEMADTWRNAGQDDLADIYDNRATMLRDAMKERYGTGTKTPSGVLRDQAYQERVTQLQAQLEAGEITPELFAERLKAAKVAILSPTLVGQEARALEKLTTEMNQSLAGVATEVIKDPDGTRALGQIKTEGRNRLAKAKTPEEQNAALSWAAEAGADLLNQITERRDRNDSWKSTFSGKATGPYTIRGLTPAAPVATSPAATAPANVQGVPIAPSPEAEKRTIGGVEVIIRKD